MPAQEEVLKKLAETIQGFEDVLFTAQDEFFALKTFSMTNNEEKFKDAKRKLLQKLSRIHLGAGRAIEMAEHLTWKSASTESSTEIKVNVSNASTEKKI